VLPVYTTVTKRLSMTTRHCQRCQRGFRRPAAFFQHRNESPKPHKCPEPACLFDGTSWSVLLKHCRKNNCRIVCSACDNGRGMHWGLVDEANYEHLRTENVCERCERHFATSGDLDQVTLCLLPDDGRQLTGNSTISRIIRKCVSVFAVNAPS
jgi:hypothetical protein